MVQMFIKRPVFATVVSVFVVLLGLLGLSTLPVTEYPDIAPPTVKIRTNYIGADAQTVLESVVIPIEEQVNGVEGMTYITSTADNNGSGEITVLFEEGIDPDMALVNVQNRVARATPLLPAEVVKAGVTTQKQLTSALMFFTFYSTNEAYDDVYIQNYMNINVIPEIKRIPGVGEAQVFGAKDYSMRVWLDPQRLANYNLTPTDVIMAINQQSRQASLGQLGQDGGEAFQYTIKYKGKYSDVKEYEDIVVRTGADGQLLRLKDVADIELGAFSTVVRSLYKGHPSVAGGIFQTPGSNARDITKDIVAYLKENEKNLPDGINYKVMFNTDEFLSASITKVVETLLEAFLLVFLVVFVFLQDLRSTIIPAIAIPVALIGTFFFLQLFGFSVNMLTLFALILAIGIVVDDAIVVVEAVHAKMEEEKNPNVDMKEITSRAMKGISTAIVSITLVMAAVFIPITFTPGPSGVFYKQFGVTLMIAITLSAVNALTLSPMLCALFLKPHKKKDGSKMNLLERFFMYFNTVFNFMTLRYSKVVLFITKRKWVAVALVILAAAGTFLVSKNMPTGFVPNEDRKFIMANIELPPSASMERTATVMDSLAKDMEKIPGVEGFSTISGISLISGMGSNNGLSFIVLDDFDKRKGNDELSVNAIIGKLFALSVKYPEARMMFFSPPSVAGFGIGSGFEMQLQDNMGRSPQELDKTTKEYLGKLMQRPEILYAQSSFNTNYPVYNFLVDVPLAAQNGVSTTDIFSAMSGYIGGVYAADFIKYGKQFRVMLQAKPEDRDNERSLEKIYVRNNRGQMSPVSQYVSLEKSEGPQSMNRFNLFNAAKVMGAPKPGFSTGDAIAAVKEVAAKELPEGYSVDFSGLTREEIKAGSEGVFILVISLIFVYLLLSAQYESFIVPLSILLSLPLGIFGAFWTQKLAGLENNIFFQISLVMLIGLLAKNAILIVEFAQQERRKGRSIGKSAILGARARLRPILMTSFAFIVGLMPLVFSSGVGAAGNRSVATGAAFGMLIGTILGLVVIPTFFAFFQALQERVKPMDFNTGVVAENGK